MTRYIIMLCDDTKRECKLQCCLIHCKHLCYDNKCVASALWVTIMILTIKLNDKLSIIVNHKKLITSSIIAYYKIQCFSSIKAFAYDIELNEFVWIIIR